MAPELRTFARLAVAAEMELMEMSCRRPGEAWSLPAIAARVLAFSARRNGAEKLSRAGIDSANKPSDWARAGHAGILDALNPTRHKGNRGSDPRLLGLTMGGLFVAHAGSDPVHQRSSAPRVRPFLTLGHLAGGHNAVCGAICRADLARQRLRSRDGHFRPTVHAEDFFCRPAH